MRKSIAVLIILAMTVASGMAHAKGNKPCSGKKGGVASCTTDGKFLCKNGSISKSKKKCK